MLVSIIKREYQIVVKKQQLGKIEKVKGWAGFKDSEVS